MQPLHRDVPTIAIPPNQEGPLNCPATTYTFPVRPGRELILTNVVHNVRVDAWFVFLKCTPLTPSDAPEYMAFVDCTSTQTRMWQAAHEYSWSVFRVPIHNGVVPF